MTLNQTKAPKKNSTSSFKQNESYLMTKQKTAMDLCAEKSAN